jgi:L-serine deaminase
MVGSSASMRASLAEVCGGSVAMVARVAAFIPLHHQQQIPLTSSMQRTFLACQKSQDNALC